MIVREYIPGFFDRNQLPREQHIGVVLEALSIPCLKEKGELTIKGNYVTVGELVVATIYPDDSKLIERIGNDVLNQAFEREAQRVKSLAEAARETLDVMERHYENYWPIEPEKKG